MRHWAACGRGHAQRSRSIVYVVRLLDRVGSGGQRVGRPLRQCFAWCDSDELCAWGEPAGPLYARASSSLLGHWLSHRLDDARHERVLQIRLCREPGPRGPAVYAGLRKVRRHESSAQGAGSARSCRVPLLRLDHQIHHASLAQLLGVTSLRTSQAAAGRTAGLHRHLARTRDATSARQGRQAALQGSSPSADTPDGVQSVSS